MTKTTRRSVLTAAAAMTAAGLADAAPAAAQAAPKPIFPVPMVAIPIVGETQVFQVRRIYCIGRNYAAHAIERGSDPNREPPFFFQKPTDAIQNVAVGEVADHPYPSLTKNYHHEVELVAALKSGGTNIPAEKALDHVYGYALGLDMTRRDLQNGMAAEKKPWEIGKSFDHAAVIGPIHPASKTGHFEKGAISLAINGTVKQSSDLSKMIWSVAEQIAKLSEAFELKAGDIIYSGTPENVGPVVKGDVLLVQARGLAGHVDQDRLSDPRAIQAGGCDMLRHGLIATLGLAFARHRRSRGKAEGALRRRADGNVARGGGRRSRRVGVLDDARSRDRKAARRHRRTRQGCRRTSCTFRYSSSNTRARTRSPPPAARTSGISPSCRRTSSAKRSSTRGPLTSPI